MTNQRLSAAERRLQELESSGVRLGLSVMRAVLAALDGPQERTPYVLVAGTNGKGSTAALLTSMLAAAGYRTGLYTSPHLESARERIRVDGLAISEGRLGDLLERVLAVADETEGRLPTYFEALTLAAFECFASDVEIAVLEVGMGGRLDATNVGSPILSVVTEIGIDHSRILGSAVAEIAREKAFVFRAGCPAVVAVRSKSAREVLFDRARAIGAGWHDVGEETGWQDEECGRVLTTPRGRYRLRTGLPGKHQEANVALAVRAAELLAEGRWPGLTRESIETGVARCRWPGRLEEVALPGDRTVLLDAAHNSQSAAALAAHLGERAARMTLLFGVLGDKDVEKMLPPLAAFADHVVLTTPPSPRAVEPAALAHLTSNVATKVEPKPSAALELALSFARPVVACGSIYLIGDVRRELRRRFGVPSPAADIDVTGRR